jgi:uncharacterized protein YggE
MLRSSSLLLCALVGSFAAFGQDVAPVAPDPALAQAIGTGTASQPANLMVLGFERVFEGTTFAEISPQAEQFRANLLSALQADGSQATLRLDIRIEETNPPKMVARGGIVVNFASLLIQPDIEAAVANALDRNSALLLGFQATPGAVTYEVADDAVLRQDAIAKATENAYLPAEAIARALRSDVYTVDQVRVITVAITSGPPPLTAENQTPTGREVTCTAEVEVTYLLTDRP